MISNKLWLGLRTLFFLLLWSPLAVWSVWYGVDEIRSARFDFLLNSNGVVSTIQQENWFSSIKSSSLILQPNDKILKVQGIPFDQEKTKTFLKQHRPGEEVVLSVWRESENREFKASVVLRSYSRSPKLAIFYLPLFLAAVFLVFTLGMAFQGATYRRSREAVEVFSLLCFGISLFFLTFLPTMTLGTQFTFSVLVPLLSVLVVHLFSIYPKRKGSKILRNSSLLVAYGASTIYAILRFSIWREDAPDWTGNLNIPFLGLSSIFSMSLLANTLLASKDFWARRRARLMSLVFLVGFVGLCGVFVAFVWETPRISLERILAVSLIFPTAFAVIFLKSNVFDLERIFRRGLHQALLLAMAVTFAVLMGLAWSQYKTSSQEDWILWVAIGIAVVVLARPMGQWIEEGIHRLIQTRVKYPLVDTLFEKSKSVTSFLSLISEHGEQNLNMKNISFRFFNDPTKPWGPSNEQRWQWKDHQLERIYGEMPPSLYSTSMMRGEVQIGEICFDGGDALAFDPWSSKDWQEVVRSAARCLEVLCLREFLSIQQGFLAHEMKNPLAIIKVCSGLLQQHMSGDEEAEELIKTIQGEVRRVASAIQSVFENSGKPEEKQNVNLSAVLKAVTETVHGRFPGGTLKVEFYRHGLLDASG